MAIGGFTWRVAAVAAAVQGDAATSTATGDGTGRGRVCLCGAVEPSLGTRLGVRLIIPRMGVVMSVRRGAVGGRCITRRVILMAGGGLGGVV